MGKTNHRVHRSDIPRNKPYKKSGKQNFDKYKGLSYDDIEDDYYDEYEEYEED